jgi:hypothetical protein
VSKPNLFDGAEHLDPRVTVTESCRSIPRIPGTDHDDLISASYPRRGPYPPIDKSGFVASYMASVARPRDIIGANACLYTPHLGAGLTTARAVGEIARWDQRKSAPPRSRLRSAQCRGYSETDYVGDVAMMAALMGIHWLTDVSTAYLQTICSKRTIAIAAFSSSRVMTR